MVGPSRPGLLAYALAATILSGACQTTATIRAPAGARAYAQRDLPNDPGVSLVSPLEVKIVSSDIHSLHFNDDHGRPFRLGQYNVSDVDHPGNLLAWAGVPFIAAGVGLLAALYANDSSDINQQGSGFVGLGYLMGWTWVVIGASLTISGSWSWARSKRAASAFESARPPQWMIAPAAPDRPALFR